MSLRTVIFVVMAILGFLILPACGLVDSDSDNPNVIGGETDLEMTNVGQKWDAYPNFSDVFPGKSYNFKDSVVVKSRSGGVVSMDVNLQFDRQLLLDLDTLAGTSVLPLDARLAILDGLAKRFGATIDTSQPGIVRIHAEPKFKVTSEGIQEFVSSKGNISKPFTIVKYGMNVGDSWSFTDDDGVRTTRTVSYKSTDDDYPVYFWRIKVLKTESVTQNDPVFDKITFVTNHKYGPVGALVRLKNGKEIPIGIYSPLW
jgi:hypothetical protein